MWCKWLSMGSTVYYCVRKISHQFSWCRLLTLIVPPSIPAPRSTSSSSRPCWFTTATCTRDILSHTAAALRHPAARHPTAPSGSGCLTILSAKPTCTRSCPPTRTCSSTRGWDGRASPCGQKSSCDSTARLSQLTAAAAHVEKPQRPDDESQRKPTFARVLVHNLCPLSCETVEKMKLKPLPT